MRLQKYLTEKVFDGEAIVVKNGKKQKITKPLSAKDEKEAEKKFREVLDLQIKYGHLEGEIKDIKIK